MVEFEPPPAAVEAEDWDWLKFDLVLELGFESLDFDLRERLEIIHKESRKRRRTKAAPAATPRTTINLRPKMEVGLERRSVMEEPVV